MNYKKLFGATSVALMISITPPFGTLRPSANHLQIAAQVHGNRGSLCSLEAGFRRGRESLPRSLRWRCLRQWRRLQTGS
jgi:hypothetical protein